MKTILLFTISIIFFTAVNGHNQLRVGDPRNSWQTFKGTIEEASLDINPKGLYMEYGLYLTFSSRGTDLINQKDTLEVTLDFDLPENAMITDSWLWFGKDTIKALILDRWTASSIYESIVKRRRDPSVLYKQSATQYQLRVFPMAGNETRKVKITYLMPVSWSKTQITASLPFSILTTSVTLPPKLTIKIPENDIWKNPVITGDETMVFQDGAAAESDKVKIVEIPSSKFGNYLKIGFDTPLKNGYYFSKYKTGDEGFYQLALSPASFLNSAGAKKVAVLVDYDASNTNLKSLDILNILKHEMQTNMDPADSFNLILSNLNIVRHSNNWVKASFTNIGSAFNIHSNQISSYSNLAALLANGINFINDNGGDGKILLISNSSHYSDYKVANKLIEDLTAMMKTKIQIHIADYQALNYMYFHTDAMQYYGNGYFYSNLAKLTSGSYQNLSAGGTESEIINSSFRYLSGSINSFDLHTSLDNGFCYSRFSLNKDENVAYLNEMILQTGKFKGEFPFLINFSGEYNKEIFSQKIEIDANALMENDSVIQKIWAGSFIRNMEKNYSSNDIVGEIIDESLKNRILSLYTSFLCLEDTSRWCLTCLPNTFKFENDVFITGAVDFGILKDTISVYPNPFTDRISIHIQLTESNVLQDLSVYDLKGSLIFKFDKNILKAGEQKTLTWNGLSQNGGNLKPGIYLLVFKSAITSKTIKLVKQ